MIAPEYQIAGFLAAFARCSAWAFTSPVVGDRTVPAKLRVVGVAAIALALSSLRTDLSFAALPNLLPIEMLLGLVAGFTARIVFSAIEAGGQLMGMELGLGFAGTIDPTAGEESLPTRRLAYALGGIAFIEAGGLEASVRVLAIAPAEMRAIGDAIPQMFDAGGRVFVAALRMAAPLLLASVIANVTMAIASRAAPALNVFSVMLALFLLVGGIVMLATAPAFVREISAHAVHAPAAMQQVLP